MEACQLQASYSPHASTAYAEGRQTTSCPETSFFLSTPVRTTTAKGRHITKGRHINLCCRWPHLVDGLLPHTQPLLPAPERLLRGLDLLLP